MDILKNKRGLTLIELMAAALLISVVFAAASSVYISALKLFQSASQSAGGGPGISTETDAFLAMEHITRRLRLANRVTVGFADSEAGNQNTLLISRQIKIRMDYDPVTLTPISAPLGTTYDKADDQWVRYRFFTNGKLRWAYGNTDDNVSASDPEVVPGLNLIDSGGSPETGTLRFERRYWNTGSDRTAGPFTITIRLTADAAGKTFTLWNNVQPHLMANSGDT